jgi:O-antigen ligase/tetratricopeptide (TPR) repeat protein
MSRQKINPSLRNGQASPPQLAGNLRDDLDRLLLRGVDLGLTTVLLAVPLLMGGRQALGQFVLVLLAVAVGLGWCLRQAVAGRPSWIGSASQVVLVAAIGLVGLQLAPLPPELIQTLSPRFGETLPLWSSDAAPGCRFGVWPCLSLTPADTRSALAILAAYTILFLVTTQRIAAIEDVERLLRWIALAGVLMAVFGLTQYLAGNGKFFWFYEPPIGDASGVVKGSFTNRNHFAHFVVLAIGPLVWWLQSRLYADRRRISSGVGVLTAALAVCVFAVLMSLSRGGIASLFAAAGVCLLVLFRARLIQGRTLALFVASALLVTVSLGIFGYRLVSSRLDDFASLERLDTFHQRRDLWRADAAAAFDFRWFGSGVGSHEQICPLYLPDTERSQSLRFTHAENGYLQIALETGLPGLLLALAGIGLVAAWCCTAFGWQPSRQAMLCFAGVIPCLLASALHSLVDFVWYVPGCMVVVVLAAACVCRLSQMVRQRSGHVPFMVTIPRPVWLLAAATMAVFGWGLLPGMFGAVRAEPGWHRTLAAWDHLDALDEANRASALETMAGDLRRTLDWNPDHAPAHARLAEIHLRLFQQSQGMGAGGMDARQVRDAALASGFHSSADLVDWLSRAFGPSHQHLRSALQHARRAVELCPLSGQVYLRLAALTFLDGPAAPGKELCVAQALRLRPYDGGVLFEAGQEASLAGDDDTATRLWKGSFQCGSRHQQRLFQLLAGRLPAAYFLETFPMDLRAVRLLEAEYRRSSLPDDWKTLRQCHAQMAAGEAETLTPDEASPLWLEAAEAYCGLGDESAGLACLQRAVACNASDYRLRYLLGTRLFRSKRLAEAEEHLSWCQQRKPQDASLQTMLDAIVTERVRWVRRPQPGDR